MNIHLLHGNHGDCSDWMTWIAAAMVSRQSLDERHDKLVQLITLLAAEPNHVFESNKIFRQHVRKRIELLDPNFPDEADGETTYTITEINLGI